MLKREWGAESNGKLPHLLFSSKFATLVPEFAVKDLPLDKTATLVPAFAVTDHQWYGVGLQRSRSDTTSRLFDSGLHLHLSDSIIEKQYFLSIYF